MNIFYLIDNFLLTIIHIQSKINDMKRGMKMKVVVIQEDIIQPDLTEEEITKRWMALKEIKEVDELEIYKPSGYPTIQQLDEMIGDADAALGVWVSPDTMSRDFLDRHPHLRYVATLGHGWREFDEEMTREKGITITNTIYGAQTIAEYAWALLMEVCHHMDIHNQHIKTTDWSNPNNTHLYDMALTPQIELYGLTCGVIGLGSIGYAFAKMAQGFGMKVISYDPYPKSGDQYDFVEQVSLDELLSRSDVISLHVPLSHHSAHMIDKKAINKMKDGVIIINTARGGLIVEEDLIEALKSKKIYAAGLDVLTEEPATKDNPLFHLDNTIITGHIAWLTKASRLRACDIAIENFKAYLQGHPKSVINAKKGL